MKESPKVKDSSAPAGGGRPIKRMPERKCIGCGEKKQKSELIRVVRTPQGDVQPDRTGKLSGRGAYLCPSEQCLRKARKSKRLARDLGCEIPPEIYEKLEKELQCNDA